MAHPNSRATFKEYCLRKLGKPVIDINLDEDQIDDRIDQALQFWYDYHFDGSSKVFIKHIITQEDADRRWVYVPDNLIGITGIIPFDQSSSSTNMFDLRYQLRLHDLYDFTSVSYVSYEITMQHLRTLNLLFSGTPQFRFNRHGSRLKLDVDWVRDTPVGTWVIIEGYVASEPDNRTITGTISTTANSNVYTGVNTIFDQELAIDDEFTVIGVSNTTVRVTAVNSSNSINVSANYATSNTGLTGIISGNSDVWNDRFLKLYATALLKKQWGANLKKFTGIQMPGGITLNGQVIYDEAREEVKELEQDMISMNTLPGEMYLG
jgi:hypothetical protein